ncbi:MAG: DNA recombination protein RmuC [Actinomycetota bacterium]|nr:DNA recombination protein RmuC [Actinomycetota bacterium]
MEVVLVALLVVAAAAIAWLLATRRSVAAAPSVAAVAEVPQQLVQQAVAAAVALANEHASRERDQAVQAAIQQSVLLNAQQLGSHTQSADASLAGRQQLIDAKLGEVQAGVHADLGRLQQLVQQLGEATSERFGQVDRSLQVHAEITQSLAGTANGLREALASSNARGQWGERMAEDVLRLAGMQEHVNYVKRTAISGDGTGIPDFTFVLPKGHVLFMDVKFPMASYLKYLEAGTEAEKSAHRAMFLRDVRARVKELAKREYSATDDRPAVDNVLLFVPNESLAAFIHESDQTLVEDAMRQHVVICSPLTLFAFLGVIRQAFDNFMIEQTSQEILGLLGKFGQQYGKYAESVEKVKRQFDTVARSFDELATTRRRALERPLNAIDDLRRRQGLPVDGQLFGEVDDGGFDNVHELGA